ncbi:MAG: hypothetical protein HQL86_01885 [Magnetococcales bacterium]|nr:hypothetical protein [Magnetococcales bacterium]
MNLLDPLVFHQQKTTHSKLGAIYGSPFINHALAMAREHDSVWRDIQPFQPESRMQEPNTKITA